MQRNGKMFLWLLMLYFGIVFALGFSGQLDRWERARYLLPDTIIGFVGGLFIAFILAVNCCESFARLLSPEE